MKKRLHYLKNKNSLIQFLSILGIAFIIFLLFIRLYGLKKLIATRVIDGDTIELVTGKRLRLIGIDTPETRKFVNGAWIEVNEPFSKEAKLFTQNFCQGKTIKIEYDVQKQDKYHRLLGYCFVGDKMLNEELLKNGLAFLFFIEPNSKYAKRLFKAHISAIKNKIGLWQDEKNIISANNMQNNIGKVKIVCGEAKKIIFSDIGCLVLFDNSFKHYIEIPLSTAFEKGQYLRSLEGQDVCAEGKIKEKSGRVFIRILHTINIFPAKELKN